MIAPAIKSRRMPCPFQQPGMIQLSRLMVRNRESRHFSLCSGKDAQAGFTIEDDKRTPGENKDVVLRNVKMF